MEKIIMRAFVQFTPRETWESFWKFLQRKDVSAPNCTLCCCVLLWLDGARRVYFFCSGVLSEYLFCTCGVLVYLLCSCSYCILVYLLCTCCVLLWLDGARWSVSNVCTQFAPSRLFDAKKPHHAKKESPSKRRIFMLVKHLRPLLQIQSSWWCWRGSSRLMMIMMIITIIDHQIKGGSWSMRVRFRLPLAHHWCSSNLRRLIDSTLPSPTFSWWWPWWSIWWSIWWYIWWSIW